jgi:hypothetical protein
MFSGKIPPDILFLFLRKKLETVGMTCSFYVGLFAKAKKKKHSLLQM